jgi:hypothetical protein
LLHENPDLLRLVQAWPELSETVRKQIIDIAEPFSNNTNK